MDEEKPQYSPQGRALMVNASRGRRIAHVAQFCERLATAVGTTRGMAVVIFAAWPRVNTHMSVCTYVIWVKIKL